MAFWTTFSWPKKRENSKYIHTQTFTFVYSIIQCCRRIQWMHIHDGITLKINRSRNSLYARRLCRIKWILLVDSSFEFAKGKKMLSEKYGCFQSSDMLASNLSNLAVLFRCKTTHVLYQPLNVRQSRAIFVYDSHWKVCLTENWNWHVFSFFLYESTYKNNFAKLSYARIPIEDGTCETEFIPCF